jgi:hypothetical protein
MDLAVAGELAEMRAELPNRDVERSRHILHGELHRFAHIREEFGLGGIPVTERHIAPKHIGGEHLGKVHRILCASKLGRVAKLGFLKIVYGGAHLEQGRKGTDPLVPSIHADGLRAQQAPLDFRKMIFIAIGLAPG